MNQGVCRVSEWIGMGMRRVIISFCGIGEAVLADSITFLVSSILLSSLKLMYQTRYRDFKVGDDEKNSYFDNLKNGFLYFKNNHLIFHVTLL